MLFIKRFLEQLKNREKRRLVVTGEDEKRDKPFQAHIRTTFLLGGAIIKKSSVRQHGACTQKGSIMYRTRTIIQLPSPEWLEGSNRWRLRVQVNGVRRAFYSSKKSIKAARAECREKALAWIEGGSPSASKTVKAAIDEYCAYIEKTQKPASVLTTKTMLSRLTEIHPSRLESIEKRDIVKACAVFDHLSRASYKTATARVRTFFKYCASKGYISDAQVPLFFDASTHEDKKKKKKVLQRDQLQTFLSLDADNILVPQFLTLTGLRIGEFCALRVCDYIESPAPFIHVRGTMSRGIRTTPKSEKGTRVIPLIEQAANIIHRYRRLFSLAVSDQPDAPLFPSIRGNFLSTIGMAQNVKNATKEHMGEAFTPHELRHTFITYTSQHAELSAIKPLYGHSEKMNTAAVYIHDLRSDEEKEAALAASSRENFGAILSAFGGGEEEDKPTS